MARSTKLTSDIRKLAAQIIIMSTDPTIDATAGAIVEKANTLDARDERKKPTRRKTKRKSATKRRDAVRKATPKRKTAALSVAD